MSYVGNKKQAYLLDSVKDNFINDRLSQISNLVGQTNKDVNWAFIEQIGDDTAIEGNTVISGINESTVIGCSADTEVLGTLFFNGRNWVTGNSDLVLPFNVADPGLAALTENLIAFSDSSIDELRAYDISGPTPVQVGNGLPFANSIFLPAICSLNDTDIAFHTSSSTGRELATYRFDGTNWSKIGNGFQDEVLFRVSITALNETDIVVVDQNIDTIQTLRFDGTNWSKIGNALPTGNANVHVITALNDTDIVYIENTEEVMKIYRFDGTNWNLLVSAPYGAQDGGSQSIAVLSPNTFAVLDQFADVIRVYRVNFNT